MGRGVREPIRLVDGCFGWVSDGFAPPGRGGGNKVATQAADPAHDGPGQRSSITPFTISRIPIPPASRKPSTLELLLNQVLKRLTASGVHSGAKV